MGRTLVVGVGNTVMGDDGLGVRALESLRERELPACVDTLEAGTALLDALPKLEHYDKVILIDAVAGNTDGVEVVRDPVGTGVPGRGFSLHDLGIQEALKLILLEKGSLPEVVIMGLGPESIGFGTELSNEVRSGIPKLVDAVMNEIQRNG